MHTGLQQRRGSQHVHPGVEDRVLDGATNAGLGRLVDNGLRALDPKQLVDPGRVEIHLVEAGVRLHVLDVPGRQVVEDDHLVAVGQQPVGDMRADEAGAPGDEDFQRR
jgi:hypothetical protein